jgi:type IV pilus assembly protein PilA
MAGQKGFSLIELLIVVAIILIIVTFAIPRVTGIRQGANEASAVRTLQTLNTAQIQYSSKYPSVGFTCNLEHLGPSPAAGAPASQTAADFVDSRVAKGSKDGYRFTIQNCNGTPAVTYQIVAVPEVPGKTGQRAFCTDESGTIKFDPNGNPAACLSGNNLA